MKPTALFISNKIYFDNSKKEGGVRVCTQEFLSMIGQLFDVKIFKVSYNISFLYRIRVKLGLNAYDDYNPAYYTELLYETIRKYKIEIVFLNLSNTAPFARLIKKIFGNHVKIILCSHGNDSGDFLHQITRFQENTSSLQRFLCLWTMGRMLQKESMFRQRDLDGVLTVSPIEESLEKWLGAKQVYMVPRTVKQAFLLRNPVAGRIGFIGDLSHPPNYYGIDQLCTAIETIQIDKTINLRIVGSPEEIGRQLAKRFDFVSYLGFMNDEALEAEAASWAFFLNPVFYYSRGVSTKLAKAFSWGIPVITTHIGCRGYVWHDEEPLYAETPTEMAYAVYHYATDNQLIEKYEFQLRNLVKTIPTIEENAEMLADFIRRI